MVILSYTVALALALTTTAILRLFYILPAFHRTRLPPRKRGMPVHLLIVLGSGGHTAEMLSLLTDLDPNIYSHRSYIVGYDDDFSTIKAKDFERDLVEKGRKQSNVSSYAIHRVPRARQIHQSLVTSPLTSLNCLYACLHLLVNHPQGYPDLILTNGPATSLILILASTILRYFAFLPKIKNVLPKNSRIGAWQMRVIYIESWARVKRPSLSGRIIVLCGLCDRVLVQWKGLETRGWGEYRGALVR